MTKDLYSLSQNMPIGGMIDRVKESLIGKKKGKGRLYLNPH